MFLEATASAPLTAAKPGHVASPGLSPLCPGGSVAESVGRESRGLWLHPSWAPESRRGLCGRRDRKTYQSRHPLRLWPVLPCRAPRPALEEGGHSRAPGLWGWERHTVGPWPCCQKDGGDVARASSSPPHTHPNKQCLSLCVALAVLARAPCGREGWAAAALQGASGTGRLALGCSLCHSGTEGGGPTGPPCGGVAVALEVTRSPSGTQGAGAAWCTWQASRQGSVRGRRLRWEPGPERVSGQRLVGEPQLQGRGGRGSHGALAEGKGT